MWQTSAPCVVLLHALQACVVFLPDAQAHGVDRRSLVQLATQQRCIELGEHEGPSESPPRVLGPVTAGALEGDPPRAFLPRDFRWLDELRPVRQVRQGKG